MNDIHSTVPKTRTRPHIEKERIKEAVLQVILPGKDTAITADKIAERIAPLLGIVNFDKNLLMLSFGGSTYQRIRDVCKEILVMDKEPVVSCPTGFYRAETILELEEFEKNLLARRAGLNRDLKAIKEIKERSAAQSTMFPEINRRKREWEY
jgi:hypothetical protein